jgi:hypothetical protein
MSFGTHSWRSGSRHLPPGVAWLRETMRSMRTAPLSTKCFEEPRGEAGRDIGEEACSAPIVARSGVLS